MSTDQEYDAQADMVDDYDGDEIETDNFIPNFRLPTSDPNTTMSLQGQSSLAHSSNPDTSAGGGTHAIVSVKMEGKRATGAESGWLFEGVGSDLCVQKWTPD